MTANHRSRNDDERGIALILTLLLSAAISLIAASLVTIGMSETTSSQNYRMMSQARYGAESGLQAAVDYLTNTYTRPGTSGSDQLTSYTLTTSPVTYNSNPVVLSSTTGSNYPDSTKVTAFQAATHGTLTAGTATIGYDVTATLTSMRTYSSYGGGTSVVQAWPITGIGTVNGAGANTATVQVTSVLEQEVTLATSYGAFAVAATCGALHFHQNSETYSYDSTSYTLSGGQPAASGTSGGDVGTNGNLQADNNVTINGTLSSPRTGVGTCVAGNPDAATLSNHATVTGGIIKLGQAKTFDTPVVPGNPPANVTNTISTSTTCANLGLTSPQCTGTANNLTLTPGAGNTLVFGNLVLSNNVHISLAGPGSISMNTLVVNNNGVLNVTTPANQTLMINVAGNPIPPSTTAPATPIDIQNNTTFTNSSWDPSRVQFIYPGTGTVNINNNGVFCGTVFAPNASMTLANNGAFYGAAIGKTVDIANNGDLYFDRHLSTLYGSASNFMLSAFNWKKY
jgi:hypothetical protein